MGISGQDFSTWWGMNMLQVMCGNGINWAVGWFYSCLSDLCLLTASYIRVNMIDLGFSPAFLMAVAMSLFCLGTKGFAPNPDIIWPETRSSPKLISVSLLYPCSTNGCPNSSFLLVTCSLGTQFFPEPFQPFSPACSLPSLSEEQQEEEVDTKLGRKEDKKYTVWGGVLQDRPRTKWTWLVSYKKSGNHGFWEAWYFRLLDTDI